MHREIAPIQVRPWTLNGLSERLIVSHYENNYGDAVRALNAVRAEIRGAAGATPPHRLRALKREELAAKNAVVLHELYFGNLGGEGNRIPVEASELLEAHFGSVAAWRGEFVGSAHACAGGAGWVVMSCSRRNHGLAVDIAADSSQGAIDAAPVLVLDMYEHAYHIDFGANATAYIDAFMRNVNWAAVLERIAAVHAGRELPSEDPSDATLPSLSIEELATQVTGGVPIQLLDVRPRHHISRTTDLIAGAVWRDPDRVEEWIGALSRDRPVAAYCAYGFHVGCNVTRALREKGFDARYVRGGVSAWYAAGGARALRPPEP
jgi:Fe-Mn family superoxide dismutase